uniref:Uncharacterized protein n=1 Tax=Timema douglasi TaxID=61478 RepID=A0A7R8VTY1_TIMDO|nr:unnamed protein product [Timema douglasi]
MRYGVVSDGKEESLEEISSKLIKSILQEKSELEHQYAEMVELQSGASSFNVPNLGFGYLEDEEDTSIEEMAQHCDKLQVLKESLKTQQVMLRNAVNSLSKVTIGEMTCKQCREHLKVDPCSSSAQNIPETVDLGSPRSWGMAHNEKIQRQLNQVAEPPSADGMEDLTTQLTPPNKPDLAPSICRMCPLCVSTNEFNEHLAVSTDEFNEHLAVSTNEFNEHLAVSTDEFNEHLAVSTNEFNEHLAVSTDEFNEHLAVSTDEFNEHLAVSTDEFNEHLAVSTDEFNEHLAVSTNEFNEHLAGEWKTAPSSPDRDSNLDLPVLGSIVQDEASVLANYATEAGQIAPLLQLKGCIVPSEDVICHC